MQQKQTIRNLIHTTIQEMTWKNTLIAFFSSGLLAFGLYNVHSISGVTEGGILGLTLLLEYWFHISPAVSSFILNGICYFIGWKLLGKMFLAYSMVASAGFSLFYGIFEQFEPLFPQLAAMPLTSAILGALFVGISVGLCVRAGGAPGGDDALAMSISAVTPMKIEWVYMLSDLTVLLLSLSYIPFRRIAYSLLTVTLSGQLIGIVQRFDLRSLLRRPQKSCS